MKFLNIPSLQCIYCFIDYVRTISDNEKQVTFTHPNNIDCQNSDKIIKHLLRDFEVEY